MESIFREIEGCLGAELYYAAISIALTIPDLCAALQHPPGHIKGSNSAGYIKWWNANMMAEYPALTGRDVYSLRCGVSHSGRFGAGQFARVIFTPLGPLSAHRCTINDVYFLDAARFCGDIVTAAVHWLEKPEVAADKNVAKNMDRIVRFRPEGLSPYVVGSPLVA